MYFIYKISNDFDQKVYFGKTKNIRQRFTKHLTVAKGGSTKYKKEFSHIHAAIAKHGSEHFTISTIGEYLNESDAYLEEHMLIKHYQKLNLPMYNVSSGGKGGADGNNKGEKHWAYGKKLSIAHRKKLSASSCNKKISDEKRDQIRFYLSETSFCQKEIACLFDVDDSCISRIRKPKPRTGRSCVNISLV